ncbi:hypothetical protein ACFO3C_20620 [Halostagnicola sp. GCM10023398]|uniref:hypothetical protein n=1 Tax=Natrialbaceae TaxID=1644061 RepID=UPI0036103B34
MKPFDPHGVRLEQLLDDVALRIIKVVGEIGPSEGREISHAIDEKLRVRDAVFLFEFL